MVKKLTFAIVALMVTMCAGTVMAGDWHMKGSLVCSDCHTMHSSVSHGWAGGAADGTATGVPHEKLLKAGSPDATCLACHDGQTFAPDVSGANTSGNATVREAGALTTGTGPFEDWKGHTLGATIAPGNPNPIEGNYSGVPTPLQCVSCHGAHGGKLPSGQTGGLAQAIIDQGQWRNLAPNVNHTATANQVRLAYSKGTNDTTLEVNEAVATGAAHYEQTNVTFNEPDATKSAMADWCKSCHTSFHGAVGGPEVGNDGDFIRHPSAGVDITPRIAGNRVKMLTSADGKFTPSCFSCHKSHGNQNAFGLIYMKGTGPVTEQGDDGTKMADLCHQCHGMGA